jgi:hypothetical protein
VPRRRAGSSWSQRVPLPTGSREDHQGAADRREPTKIHDIKDLADRAAPAYPNLPERMDKLRGITLWGFAYRYPPEEEMTEEAPTEERVRSVIKDIRNLFAAARALDPYSR